MTSGPSRPSPGAVVQHLVLRCRDIEASHRFYTEILGFEQVAKIDRPGVDMRFYRSDASRHHDLALAQLHHPETAPPVETPWRMYGDTPGIDHIAIAYPGREAWLDQVAWMKAQGVEFLIRGDHGMTHSVYVSDPDGNGIEVLYDLPREVWQGDVHAALNYFDRKDPDGTDAVTDTTDYVRF
jgi:catechol 2,3-dioxygenase